MSRLGGRRAVLTMTAAVILALGGVAVAGAIGSGGNGSAARPVAAASPSTGAPTVTPSPSQGPLGPTLPDDGHSSSPSPEPTAQPRHPAVETPTAETASPEATKPAHRDATEAPCPSRAERVDAARRLLQHADAMPSASLVTAGPRTGVLGTADPATRTVTLYLRSCAEEPASRLAVVWAYEAGQLVPVETWDPATRSRWEQLRGATFGSTTQLRQDVAAVFAYWQTGTTQSWQSPVAPPSAGELAGLAPFLRP